LISFTFSTIKNFNELDEALRELGYKPTSIREPEKEEGGLYHQTSIYTKEEVIEDEAKEKETIMHEVKVHEKYSDEKNIREMVPLAKITIDYEGSLPGLRELQENGLDEQEKQSE